LKTIASVKGNLTMLLLASIEDQDRHGYGMIQEIERRCGIRLAGGAVYPALRKLLTVGLISGRQHHGQTPSERDRYIYRLTKKGRVHLQLARDEWYALVDSINGLVPTMPRPKRKTGLAV
jgi:PadR family transcriptional regulator